MFEKGFGFIRTAEHENVFFHAKDIRGIEFERLQPNDRVMLDVEIGDKGPIAKNVKLDLSL